MIRRHRFACGSGFGAVLAVAVLSGVAKAEPALQLYIEGAQYVNANGEDTWVFSPAAGTTSLRLWAIGNVGQFNPIVNVRLAVLYDTAYETAHGPVQIQFTPTVVGGDPDEDGHGEYQGFTDSTAPDQPDFVQHRSDGSIPLLSDGSELPRHGEYGPGKTWQEFLLGDFSRNDTPLSPLGDFITGFPTSLKQNAAQINVYNIAVGVQNPDTAPPIALHFDLYDSVQSGNKGAVFAPFSHDSEGGITPGHIIPEPSTLALSFSALVVAGVATLGRRRRRRNQPASEDGQAAA